MSKMGRVAQEIMEKHGGRIPAGYTLADYFKDKENEEKIKESKAGKTAPSSNKGHDNVQENT